MPFLLLIIGVLLAVVAIRNTMGSFSGHLADDLRGSGGGASFPVWIGAILAIGMIGYLPKMQGFSRALLALVVVVVLLRNGKDLSSQFFSQLEGTIPASSAGADLGNPTVNVQLGGGGASSSGNVVGSATSTASGLTNLLGFLF